MKNDIFISKEFIFVNVFEKIRSDLPNRELDLIQKFKFD